MEDRVPVKEPQPDYTGSGGRLRWSAYTGRGGKLFKHQAIGCDSLRRELCSQDPPRHKPWLVIPRAKLWNLISG